MAETATTAETAITAETATTAEIANMAEIATAAEIACTLVCEATEAEEGGGRGSARGYQHTGT